MPATPTRKRSTRSRPWSRGRTTSDDVLLRYLRDVSAVKPHQADEEFRAGHALREAEIDQWTALASAPLQELTLAAVRRSLEATFGAEAAATLIPPLLASSRQQPRELACGLRDLDDGQLLLRSAMQELEAAASSADPDAVALGEQLPRVRTLERRARRLRDQFVRSNLRLVVSVARRFSSAQVPLTDLIQEGNLGLIRAVERYDYRRGFRFSTYACWWIRNSILRAVADRERFVRVPIHMLDVGRRLEGARQSLTGSFGRAPTDEELAVSTRVSLDRVQQLRTQLSQSIYSLEHPLFEDGRPLAEALPDPEALTPMNRIEEQSLQAQVTRKLERLRPIERDVLRSHFGLNGDGELTLREIGDRYQLSRERIRQIQNQALGKIRKYLQRSNAV